MAWFGEETPLRGRPPLQEVTSPDTSGKAAPSHTSPPQHCHQPPLLQVPQARDRLEVRHLQKSTAIERTNGLPSSRTPARLTEAAATGLIELTQVIQTPISFRKSDAGLHLPPQQYRGMCKHTQK